jgi:hypothetical protein
MSITRVVALALLMMSPMAAQVHHILVTSDVVRVASMTARDEGYDPDADGTFLSELRTANGKEPYPGYSSITLYHNGHPVRSYSIRVETGDVVDATDCKVFRYPDLLEFKRRLLKDFGSKEVSLETIETEIGCERLETVPRRTPTRKSK